MTGFRLGATLAMLALASLAIEASVGRTVPLPVPLSELPFHVSSWSGRAESIPPEVLKRARPDNAISRRYSNTDGGIIVLYVGYYAREASRSQVLATCQAKCEMLEEGIQVIDIQGTSIAVNRARLRQDGIEQVVMYWFQNGRRVTHDANRAKFDQAMRAILHHRSDGAIVRVSAPIDRTAEEAHTQCIAFVKALFPVLRLHLPN